MAKSKRKSGALGNGMRGQAAAGVWNRGTGSGPTNPIRVRTKRLDEINGDKIALAYWLLAKQIVENGTELKITEEDARRAAGLDDEPSASGGRS